MQIFDIVEELEKERKKNKELEEVFYKLKTYIEEEIFNICEEAGIGPMIYDKLNELLEETKGSDNNE